MNSKVLRLKLTTFLLVGLLVTMLGWDNGFSPAQSNYVVANENDSSTWVQAINLFN